jgi:hypothetical protein
MKARLLHPHWDFSTKQELPPQAGTLVQDLELDTLVDAMAAGDGFVADVARRVILTSLAEPQAILYRQRVLRDCLMFPAEVRQIYQLAVEAIELEKKHHWGIFSNYPDAILHRAVEVLQVFIGKLMALRQFAEGHAGTFQSEGFVNLFAMLQRELDDSYFADIQQHLRKLRFRDGVTISARLGKGNVGIDFVLREPARNGGGWLRQILGRAAPSFVYRIAGRDEAGARALAELRQEGINLVANALAQSTDHILSFFTALRTELAFYVGCLNLHERLTRKGEPTAFPVPTAAHERTLHCEDLYDVCLSLNIVPNVVGNAVDAKAAELTFITGANQGGKSTLLRALGLAQLMMQCGMFVAARSFSANVCSAMFTHFKREEDSTMKSGKLDEELARMSDIVNHLGRNALVLFNESFAATNEREGSEIARQILRALLARRIKICFVTHMYELAHSFARSRKKNVMFLRAERRADGERTFKIIPGAPLKTSYGRDLHSRIFEAAQAAVPADEPVEAV